ncbi:DNA repair protein RadC [bacterium]|nr:DNA repair protein RadC [bacterium]
MLQVKERYSGDKPREKLLANGAPALSTTELIAIILGSGQGKFPLMTISRQIAQLISENQITLEKLQKVKGVGIAKACQLLSVKELSHRMSDEKSDAIISSASDIAILLSSIRNQKQEHFVTITLDGAHRIIEQRTIFVGTLNQSIIHPREVFADAITDRAASIILAHNHPSGTLRPSEEDKIVTERLKLAGDILGIEIIDHVIITKESHWSFKGNHLL